MSCKITNNVALILLISTASCSLQNEMSTLSNQSLNSNAQDITLSKLSMWPFKDKNKRKPQQSKVKPSKEKRKDDKSRDEASKGSGESKNDTDECAGPIEC